ncbi:glycosyltransferase [Kocuria sediminis]|uniref:Glycosyltransferase n=1 Tax=Kocuria sediminis TaxID=1038857 RepID=A0A6N8GVQ2_9MICC|nr:glycosyltransferase [Kocuria sediminis]MUN64995.1 glycosyltransferase [Kocuria sediminis]
MRILHIVTLISTDGAYGGPVRVATNLTREVDGGRYDVEVWGGSKGYAKGTNYLDGVRVKLFSATITMPALGFATTIAPGLLLSVFRSRRTIDVLHIHLARDFVTMPAALLARMLGIPYIVQTHGMITPKWGFHARAFDRLFTVPALRGAVQILVLTPHEKEALTSVDASLSHFTEFINGIRVGLDVRPHINTSECQVLFMARMHSRKRPIYFVRTAVDLLKSGRGAKFCLVGPDEGELPLLQREIKKWGQSATITYEGALPPSMTYQRLAQCDILVLPSVDEPFPMTIIEAMSLAKPVIITDSCGLAPHVQEAGAGIVIDHNQESLTDAVDRLIRNPLLRRSMGLHGRNLVRQKFDISLLADRLRLIYDKASRVGLNS